MNHCFTSVLLFVGALALTACGKGGEEDMEAKAQQCLDKVPAGAPQNASACLQYVKDYNSPRANFLKCSIYLTSGGLIETKIAQAYTLLSAKDQTNQAASFLTALALNVPDVTTAFQTAQTADTFCQGAGSPGIAFLSKAILTGTQMSYSITSLGLGTVDPSNPASINTAVQTLLTNCGGVATPPAGCPDAQTLGSSATAIASTYCGSSGANSTVCSNVNGAVTSAGGDTAAVGNALMCYLKNKKYDAQTGLCS